MDTTLNFPEEFDVYVREAFRPHAAINPEFVQMFRVISAAEFLDKFASDRSRMRTSDGSWLKPPPPYPCIQTNSCDNNIDDFISVDEAVGIGQGLHVSAVCAAVFVDARRVVRRSFVRVSVKRTNPLTSNAFM
ncbi:hypothetical protein MRX96_030321 [Rhipicephalus microplus]